jgi:hypothetical protein
MWSAGGEGTRPGDSVVVDRRAGADVADDHGAHQATVGVIEDVAVEHPRARAVFVEAHDDPP